MLQTQSMCRPPKWQLSILLNFSFQFIDTGYFSSSFKLRHCRKIILPKMRFLAKKNAGYPKAPRDFPPRKYNILLPPSGCLRTPIPLSQSLYGGTYADVTTNISRSHRLPNFLSSMLNKSSFFQLSVCFLTSGLFSSIQEFSSFTFHFRNLRI